MASGRWPGSQWVTRSTVCRCSSLSRPVVIDARHRGLRQSYGPQNGLSLPLMQA
jgi:hypothetical protein